MRYQDDVPKIPTAAVTIEDAELMARFQARGQTGKISIFQENIQLSTVVATLYMEAQTIEPGMDSCVISDR